MKKFKYRLEPILNVKSHVEKERQKEHSVAVEKVMSQKDHLAQLDTNRESILERQRIRLSGRLSIAELLICSRYLLKLKRDSLAGVGLLRGLEKEAEAQHQALIKASRERQIYEKLKEKQLARFLKEVERLESKETDEIAANNQRRRHQS